jgi:hypothetical protein
MPKTEFPDQQAGKLCLADISIASPNHYHAWNLDHFNTDSL